MRQSRRGIPERGSNCPTTIDSASLRGIRSHAAGHLPAAEPPTIAFRSSGGGHRGKAGRPPGWDQAPDGGRPVAAHRAVFASLRNSFGSAGGRPRDGASGALRRRDRWNLPLPPARRELKPLGHAWTGVLYAGLQLRTLSTTALPNGYRRASSCGTQIVDSNSLVGAAQPPSPHEGLSSEAWVLPRSM